MAAAYKIGLLGLGTVGSQVAERLEQASEMVERRTGIGVCLHKVLVRDAEKKRRYNPRAALTTDAGAILDDPEIDVIVEVIGGEEPAREFLERAIRAGKHVITANKEVMAKHGPALLELALEHEVDVYFEAAVGGGIPLISTFKIDLLANEITSIQAIINGTTNYILDGMSQGRSYEDALAEARRLGYAEADPSSDVDGHDSVFKLCVMASIAFSSRFHPGQIHREGITGLVSRDFQYADEMGYAIKLLAQGRKRDGAVELRVHPTLIPHSHLLSRVGGSNNAAVIDGDLVGEVLLYGQGAGGRPTASAVVGDLIDLIHSMRKGVNNRIPVWFDRNYDVRPMDEVESRAYFRIEVEDHAGVLADITEVFGRHRISIHSIIQKSSDRDQATAELVILTQPAPEKVLQAARRELDGLECVTLVHAFLRVQ
ncbi:MAG TPA: homoserine dehydrogenase [Candidatus Dormibacteraeota bacterium]|jgi:homoserine dehydrogenase|nr:homoserine dehydrogenase [Candidatus Dormibacteraeota bacterium]